MSADVPKLDNAVWHSLQGPHRAFAQRVGRAQRFDPAVAPFSALPDEPTEADWADLATLVRPGLAVLFRHHVRIPDGWNEMIRFSGLQMVHEDVHERDPFEVEELDRSDVPEMLELVGRTEPGPFTDRTIELGRYVGVRRDGVLVAMAGQRLRLPGFVEISAVCTDHAHRGQGLAAGLVRTLVADIRANGDAPILHVLASNVTAIRLYESLGFVVRCPLDGVVLGVPQEVR